VSELDVAAVGFARLLRGAGIDVPVGTTVTFAQALAEVGVASRARVYWAGRATLLRRPEDAALFDRAFAAWWERRFDVDLRATVERELSLAFDSAPDDDGADDADDGDADDTPTVQDRVAPGRAHAPGAAPTSAAPCAARCAPAASRSTGRSSRPPPGRVVSCSCAT
jgi:uncharacterized protein with von Willebrand factor type A (vWA) domain